MAPVVRPVYARIPDLGLASKNLEVLSERAQIPEMKRAPYYRTYFRALKGADRLTRLANEAVDAPAPELEAAQAAVHPLFEEAKAALAGAGKKRFVTMSDTFAPRLAEASLRVAAAEDAAARLSPERHVFDYTSPEEELIARDALPRALEDKALRACYEAERFRAQPLMGRLGTALLDQMGSLKVIGAENIPDHGPFVFLLNHDDNALDMGVSAEIGRHTSSPLRIIRAGGLGRAEEQLGVFLGRATGVFPVYQGAGLLDLSGAVGREFLARGQAVGGFPEGTRPYVDAILPHYAGLTTMALDSHVPVVVMAVAGLKDPESQAGPVKSPVMVVAPPISTADLPATEWNQAVLQDLGQATMVNAYQQARDVWRERVGTDDAT